MGAKPMDKSEFMWAKLEQLDARISEAEKKVSAIIGKINEYESSLDILLIGKSLEAKLIQLERELEDVRSGVQLIKIDVDELKCRTK